MVFTTFAAVPVMLTGYVTFLFWLEFNRDDDVVLAGILVYTGLGICSILGTTVAFATVLLLTVAGCLSMVIGAALLVWLTGSTVLFTSGLSILYMATSVSFLTGTVVVSFLVGATPRRATDVSLNAGSLTIFVPGSNGFVTFLGSELVAAVGGGEDTDLGVSLLLTTTGVDGAAVLLVTWTLVSIFCCSIGLLTMGLMSFFSTRCNLRVYLGTLKSVLGITVTSLLLLFSGLTTVASLAGGSAGA